MIPQKILTPYNKILIFDNQLCMSNMVLIFDTDQAQINSEKRKYRASIVSGKLMNEP